MTRLKALRGLVDRYGRLAVLLHFGIWFGCIALFTAAVHLGVGADLSALVAEEVPAAAWLVDKLGGFGLALSAGYAATQLLKVPRIALTLVVTPMVARRLGRYRGVELTERTP